MIQHSDVYKGWFTDYQGDAASKVLDKSVRDLGLAKHRFDSSSRPLAHFLLNFEALIMTASRIMIERPHKEEEQNAVTFLRPRSKWQGIVVSVELNSLHCNNRLISLTVAIEIVIGQHTRHLFFSFCIHCDC